MHTEQSDNYRGCIITTRSMEVVDWCARDGVGKATHTPIRRFTASFTVAGADGEVRWQQFPIAQFRGSDEARANALSAAKTSVDQQSRGIRFN